MPTIRAFHVAPACGTRAAWQTLETGVSQLQRSGTFDHPVFAELKVLARTRTLTAPQYEVMRDFVLALLHASSAASPARGTADAERALNAIGGEVFALAPTTASAAFDRVTSTSAALRDYDFQLTRSSGRLGGPACTRLPLDGLAESLLLGDGGAPGMMKSLQDVLEAFRDAMGAGQFDACVLPLFASGAASPDGWAKARESIQTREQADHSLRLIADVAAARNAALDDLWSALRAARGAGRPPIAATGR